jgi:uncharacterized membrane protein YeaQ/YmgE (transglycosylase-associated protein family)
MALESFIAVLIVGLIAGVLASVFVKRGGMGLIGDILIGIGGAFIIAFMLPTVGISLGGGLTGAIILAVIGAVLALWLIRKAKTA